MSRIFEAFNTPRKNGFNEISLQKSFQGRISDRTRTDRCSARTCSRTSSRCARSGRCGFATSGGNWNKHNRRGAAPTIGQCRDPGGWHRPPPASRAGTDGDPALSIVSVERGRASERGKRGPTVRNRRTQRAHCGRGSGYPVSRVRRHITPATPARTHPWRKRILAPTPLTNTTAPPCTMKFLKIAAHEISTGLLHNLLAACPEDERILEHRTRMDRSRA